MQNNLGDQFLFFMVAPLYNRVMWLVSKSDFKNCAVTYLTACVCVNTYGHICTSNQKMYYVSHLISVKNVLSHFMRLAWSGDGSDCYNWSNR